MGVARALCSLFGPKLLMPETLLKTDLREMGLDAPKLVERYKINEQAMWIQLIKLRLASRDSESTHP